jgi:hypothetical protein
MNKDFVNYDQALSLKELGFDEPCFLYWYKASNGYILVKEKNQTFQQYILAPTFSQAFRFFREKYKIGTWIHHYFDIDKGDYIYSWVITLPHKDDGFVYDIYEEAESACLDKLIEIAKKM